MENDIRSIKIEPIVSVITAMYNSEKYINATIDSVLAQTFDNWEMIIVDDGSTDRSAEIVRTRSSADERIKFYQLSRNHGMPFAARNLATEKAQGRYIAFLDSDDRWLPEKLERQLQFMSENKYPVTFTSYSKVYEEEKAKTKVINIQKKIISFEDLLKTNHIGCLTAMYDVKQTGKLIQYEHKYEDYIMWLLLLKKGFKAYGMNEVLGIYRVHKKSISTNKFKMARINWKIYRNIMKLDIFMSSWYFVHYCLNGWKKI